MNTSITPHSDHSVHSVQNGLAAALLGMALFMAGCAHMGRPQEDKSLARDNSAAVTTQYAPSSGVRCGFNTFEVFLRNDSDRPIRYGTPRLNGRPLLDPSLSRVAAPADVKLDGVQIPFPGDAWRKEPLVTWWQYYPSQDAKPGETILLQVNFRQSVTSPRMLEIPEIGGICRTAMVSRFYMPADVLSAVTFTPDFKRMYVQVTSRNEAKRIWVNGDEVKVFRLLRRAMPSESDVLAFEPPMPVHAGIPLHVKVEFINGRIRQELFRAMSGISLDSYVRLPVTDRTEFSLDENPPVVMLEGDPTCSDTYGRRRGSSAPHMVSDRLHLFAKEKDKLTGLVYCTAIYPELWNIYGPIADAVYAKPYQLGWGYRKMKFLEEEEDAMRSTAQTAAPRPMMWIPQRLKPHGGRHLEAAELETLGWVSLVRGGKGIRYHQWRPETEPDGFKDCPWLQPAIRDLNRAVRSKEQMLSALVLESEQKIEDKSGGWSKVYTSWAGEAGVLVMVRNLNYEADAMPPAGSTGPYFRVQTRKTVEVPLALPKWLKGRGPVDFLNGENLPFKIEKGVMRVTLPELGSYRLIWLANVEL